VSQALEKLRKKAQYQPTHGGARFRGPYSQKIVNRFLGAGEKEQQAYRMIESLSSRSFMWRIARIKGLTK
jgi:hypothetical protein